MMMDANHLNFSGGPGALPDKVLHQLQTAISAVPEVGLSILGISHRSDWFAAVVREAEDNIRQLMGLANDTHVLFLQGGATQQFAMLPMNLLRDNSRAADYLHTGYWSGKAIEEARHCVNHGGEHGRTLRTVWDGSASDFRHLPTDAELELAADAAYFHYVSNETVEGLQFHRIPGRDDVPRICDMSSDFLSAPGDFERFAMIYAHAQKNIGPAGVTVVILKDEFLRTLPDDLPGFINYHAQAAAHSIYNTPPVFAIYAVVLVTRWLKDDIGGLARMAELNQRKAALLYQTLDASDGFYQGHTAVADRSHMNVSFNLPDAACEQRFLAAAKAHGFSGLKGHRAIGGLRASLYNGLTLAAVESLAGFMEDFRRQA